jgi:hypothetical protein
MGASFQKNADCCWLQAKTSLPKQGSLVNCWPKQSAYKPKEPAFYAWLAF